MIRYRKGKVKEKKFNQERISHPTKHYSNQLTHFHTEVVPGDEPCVLVLLLVALSVSYSTEKIYKFEQDRGCDQWHHGKQNRVARASEYFPPSGRKMFTHLLYSFLSLLLDLYELKAEPIFSFCWVISEQSLRALKYKSLWTVFSCEWIFPDCDITKESQARAI